MASTTGFTLTIGQDEAFPGCPSVNCGCGRITVLLGANGTGKSQILKKLKDSTRALGTGRKRVYIEGGRVVSPLSGRPFARTQQARRQLRVPEPPPLEEQYEKSLTERLQKRLDVVFELLVAKDDPQKRRYYDAIRKWESCGSKGERPKRGDTLLESVFDRFHKVFPDITLKCDPESYEVSCDKGGKAYPVEGLSDGEKQVLAMLADLTSCAPLDAAFIVDEPELNLHPLLACRLWDAVEADRPDALFIYGTHCISFAMRRSVETRILLGRRGESAQPLPDVNGLDPQEAEEFLGAIPAIAVAHKVVAVEGRDESFDAFFYQWLLGDGYKVVPVGSCESVVGAARGTGLWEKIAAKVRIGGVVDRDYRAESEIGSLGSDSLVVLDFHEAESYLCDPEFVVAFANAFHASVVSRKTVEDEIMGYAKETANRTAFERTTRGALFRLQLSAGSNAWVSGVTVEEIKKRLAELVEKERQRFGTITAQAVTDMFVQEKARIEKLIDDRNAHELLKVVPGKELLAKLARLVGSKDMAGFLRAAPYHMTPHKFPHLKDLADKLSAVFGRNDAPHRS